MEPYEYMKYVGNIQQLAYARPIVWQEGLAAGMRGFDVKNGSLHFQIMIDKCLDISSFCCDGFNFSFLAKQGLTGRIDYSSHGEEGPKSLMGGMMFTCGLENTCLPCTEEKASFPMHGRIRNIPAENLCVDTGWKNGKYEMCITGTMREAEIFGKNLVLQRTIKTVLGEKSIEITDVITNESYKEEIMMLLYHINGGYPLMDENAEVILPTRRVLPRDSGAQKKKENWMKMEPPQDNEPERVYLHELCVDDAGNTFGAFVNRKAQKGLLIEFNQKYLPKFVQWKSISSGDYVMGLEPTNAGVYGRTGEEKPHFLKPGEQEKIQLKFTVLDGAEELAQLEQRKNALCKEREPEIL